MRVNKNVIENLYNDAGYERTKKAQKYRKEKRVVIQNYEYENPLNFEIKAKVKGNGEIYNTYVLVKEGEIEDVSCTCLDYYNHYGVCKHSLATVLTFVDEGNNYSLEDEQQEIENETADTEEIKEQGFELFEDMIENKTIESENKLSTKNISNPNTTQNEYRIFNQMVSIFYNEELEDVEEEETELKTQGSVKLEPSIYYDKFTGEMKVEFKIGKTKMYKIKNLSEFYTRTLNKENYSYGKNLKFVHIKENFEEESQKLLDFLMKYAEIIKYANSNSNSNYRFYGNALSETSIILSNSGIDDLFEILKGKEILVKREYTENLVEFTEEKPDIEFILNKLGKDQYEIVPSIDIYKVSIIIGKKYKYVLSEKKLYRCTKEFENSNLKMLEIFRQNYMTEVKLGKKELSQLFSIVIPKVKDAINLENLREEEIEKYKPEILVVKVYLDFDKNDYLIADVKFQYGNNEFNPLDEKQKINFARNKIQETKTLNIFRKTGFMFDINNLRFILPDNDKIYQFLTDDINYYMQKFDVLVTENFKQKQIRQNKIGSLGVKVENNLLSIDLKKLDIDINELEDIMSKYNLKKKYHRLKDGSFLNLENNEEIEFLDKLTTGMGIDYKEIEEGEVNLPIYRSFYLDKLLKGINSNQVNKNSEYKKVVKQLNKENIEEEIQIPEKLENTLRYYQKTGFKWLKTLDKYNFGGILADDMGLGKTIQMLSIIVDYVENTSFEERRASIVVSPSSLALNWENEAKKFAEGLQTMVINGTLQERKKKISEIQNYDLVITSYDLLKRDIELYKDKNYNFRFIIADEAQYLKNSNTQNAKAIKKILADTKYALTGTPIENSLAELWSIFDYIMPGYLFAYKQFKNMYETPIVKDNDVKTMNKLKMLIEPFVLRRTKKEVLTELPDKTVTVLSSEMGEEQKNIYLSYLAQAKQEVAEEINVNGVERSHIKILAALTRLRQICCHPSLFIDNYKDGSSKLEQCMEIIEDAIKGNHKILLFSGYTSMFSIIEEELKERNIKYFKLTGATKVEERMKLVDEFNQNPEVKIFLISLKAGGTGLNLTGADMVIHYDPWWNLSTENQATDRAYRIGQKNNVQVYKLITKNSIEEKIYELQQKKAELMDNMLSTKVSFINKLSKDDIMKLFDTF